MATYFDSTQVKVFPCTYRNYRLIGDETQYNPESRLTSEKNFVNIYGRAIGHDSYIISATNTELKCNIAGYYFEINDVTGNILSNIKRLGISIYKETYGSSDNEETYLLGRTDTNADKYCLDVSGQFKGLAILDPNEELTYGDFKYYLDVDLAANTSYRPADLLKISDNNVVTFDRKLSVNGANSLIIGNSNSLKEGSNNSLILTDNQETKLNNAIIIGDTIVTADNENYEIGIGKNITTKDKAIVIGENIGATGTNIEQILIGNGGSDKKADATNLVAIYNNGSAILNISNDESLITLHTPNIKVHNTNKNAKITADTADIAALDIVKSQIFANKYGITTTKLTATNTLTVTNKANLNGGIATTSIGGTSLNITNYINTVAADNTTSTVAHIAFEKDIVATDKTLTIGTVNASTLSAATIGSATQTTSLNGTSAKIAGNAEIDSLSIKGVNFTVTEEDGALVITC